MGDVRWPVSIKGVVTAGRNVLLVLNDRDEWELPGGRLEPDESPEQCVQREIQEETGLTVTVDKIIDSWVYPVLPNREVLIVTYRCLDLDESPTITISDEHQASRWVPLGDCPSYPMPVGYLRSIQAST